MKLKAQSGSKTEKHENTEYESGRTVSVVGKHLFAKIKDKTGVANP
jgi:hypothetical protein